MQPERVRIALRQRTGFEAVDLGFALARRHARSLAVTWLALVVPLAAGLVAVLWRHPFWTLLLLWWLRPVFARVPLHVLSRGVLGEPSGVGDVLRHLPRMLRPGLVASLGSQRLSPARAMLLPVLQLEGLRGAARRSRCRLMVRHDLSAAAGLHAAGAHFNAMLALGLLLLVPLLLPDEVRVDSFAVFLPLFENASDDPRLAALPTLYLLGISVVEPLLAAGGFALYLNRRIALEGWDIELAFRALSRRTADAPGRPARRARAAAALALALAVGGLPAAAVRADPCAGGGFASAKPCAEDVVAHPDFGATRTETRWRLRERDPAGGEAGDPWLPAWLAVRLSEWLAGLFELAMWSGLAVAVVAFFVALSRHAGVPPDEPPPEPLPAVLFGLDLDPRSLPDDLLGAAHAAFARGDAVGALSLLYRGALVRLAASSELAVPESATELECLGLVRRAAPGERAGVFETLTSLWLRARYGAEPPAREPFEALCARYAAAFSASGGDAA